MTVKVQMVNGGSDSVDFVNATGTTLAQVKGYDDGSNNGHLEFYTDTSGTLSEKVRVQNGLHIQQDSSSNNRLVFRGQPSSSYRWNIDNYGSSNQMRFFRENDADASGGSVMMTIDSSGNLLVGQSSAGSIRGTSQVQVYNGTVLRSSDSFNGIPCVTIYSATDTTNGRFASFTNSSGTEVGSITRSGTSTTAYNTSSDYRLKENIAPMTGALSAVQALKPCTYTWKADGSDGQGFIAHELQEVIPDCVTGEKDAVDANGNPIYQGIDTSFLVATLTAAIQELKAEVDSLKAQLEAK